MKKLQPKPANEPEDDEDTLMFDLIDDFCLIVDKSAKRVSAIHSKLVLGLIDNVANKRISARQFRS